MFAASRRTLIAGAAASLRSGLAAARDPLAEIEAKVGGRLGVAALDVASGRRLGWRAGERFPMCSTFKAMAVAAVLKRVDAGQERLDRFVRYGQADLLSYAPVTRPHVGDGGMKLADLCAAAVELSDNTAANLILASIGGPAGWTGFVRSLGDGLSRLDRNEPTLNSCIPGDPRDTTTPAAMVGRPRRRAARRRAVAGLPRPAEGLDARHEDRPYEAARRPSGRVAGRRQDRQHGGGTSNDIAVAWAPRGPIVIACYLTAADAATSDARDAAIADVGRLVAKTFAAPDAARRG